MALHLLIVDDEPLARLRLRTLVQDLQQPALQSSTRPPAAPAAAATWQVVGEAASTEQALVLMQRHTVHALLLDIRMPGRDGLERARALRAMPAAPALVFVTAHAEHALRAFELDAADYLTKPVRRERLAEALQRLAARVQLQALPVAAGGPVPAQPPPTAAPVQGVQPVLVINERDRMLRLPVADVLYCRADQKQVLLRTPNGSHLIDDSLADLEGKLAGLGGRFIRVHRNALVSLHAMRELELRAEFSAARPDGSDGWAVRVAPLNEWLSVSRRQVAAVKAALGAPD
jgi:two-component system response regulator AlgR